MPPLRPEEEWVRRLMEVELGVPVNQHDDGSRPAMHDLDVIYGELERAAVEVTAAVDPESTELWNVVTGDDRWVDRDLVGGWSVHVKPNARGLRRDLPGFLRALERSGLREFRARVGDLGFEVAARRLGVVHATQSDTDFPGSIYVTLDLPSEQVGGCAAGSGDALAEWLTIFLRDDERADVRDKLARSSAAECHAFVVVSGLSGAPFSVTDLLIRNDAPLPTLAPKLPPEVTDVWAASTWDSGIGFWWSSGAGRWQKFTKQLS